MEITYEKAQRGVRTLTLGLALKGAIGGCLVALVVFSVFTPLLGFTISQVGEVIAALIGTILGVLAAALRL